MAKSGVEETVDVGLEPVEYHEVPSLSEENLNRKVRAPSYKLVDSNLPPMGQRISYGGIKWVQVPQGYCVIKFGMGGKPRKDMIKGSGIRFVSSFGGWMGSLVFVNLKRDYIDLPKQQAGTSDGFEIGVDGVVHFKVNDPQKAVLGEANYRSRLEQLAMQNLRNEIGNMDIFQAMARRGQNVEHDSTEFERMGVEVYGIGVKDINIPDHLESEVAKVGKANLEKKAMILIAEGEVEAAKKLKEIAAIYGDAPVIAYMRYLESMVEMSKGGKSSFVFAPGMFDLSKFGEFMGKFKI